MMSMAICWKGSSMTGSGTNPVSLNTSDIPHVLDSSPLNSWPVETPPQSFCHPVLPKCPDVGRLCAIMRTVFLHLRGITSCFTTPVKHPVLGVSISYRRLGLLQSFILLLPHLQLSCM